MKKKIFIKVRNVSVVMLAVCGVSIFCSGMCVSAETQREISSIQIMGFKHPVKEQLVDEHPRHAEKNKLLNAEENSLDKDIAALAETDVLSDAPELDEKEFHIPVTLHYTDGTKDTYCFFKVDDTFYMKNEAGSVYADADFIGEYVSLPEEQDTGFNQDSELQSGVSIHLPDELALSMAKDMEVLDERYYFVLDVSQDVKYGLSQEEAISQARAKSLGDAKRYEYALRHGLEMPEDELLEKAEKWKMDWKSADNYEEICKEYEAAGLGLDEFYGKVYDPSNIHFRIWQTNAYIYEMKSYDFRHGEDKVGDTVCEDMGDYWNHFIMDEVLPEAESYDLSEYEKRLDEAEAYYLEMTDE